MAQDGRIYDGQQVTVAMDGDQNPSNLPPTFVSSCVNRTFRKGVNSTRPPFTDIAIQVAFGYDPSILTNFHTGNFQGALAYQAIKSSSVDGFVVAVAGTIYFLSIVNNIGTLYELIGGNDPTMMHTWFVQAEDWLYIQNGYQDPVAWSGDITGTPTNLQAQGLITGNIELTWVNNAPGAISTEIQFQANGNIFMDIAIVAMPIDSYTFIAPGLNVSSVSRARSSNVATIVTAQPHGFTTGQSIIIQSMENTSYDTIGTAVLSTPSTTSFTYSSVGPNESTTADPSGQIGLQVASTTYAFQVRSLFPDGSFTNWSNIATTTVINPQQTAKLPNAIFRLNPAAQQMPTGTLMAYAYGRVWVSDAQNNIFASDIIYGNGFTTTSNTQNFTEETYWDEGGSFTPPANLGLITGMKIMPSLNINVRGQGELVVMCENGAFTLDGSQDRSTWSTSNIQKVSLIGRGCRSPWSLCGINNEIYFRSDDGWAFYNNAQVDFYESLSFRKISKEVDPWVSQDTPWLRQFESAMFFDNRIIATVSPFTVSPSDPSTMGLHRPSRAMIVLDVETESPISPDASLPQRWNGLFEGPQPTQMITAQINGVQRGFCFSFDQDGVNRLYELQLSDSQAAGVDDYSQSLGNVPIQSYFITRRFDWAGNDGANKFVRKQIVGGEVWISNINEAVTVACDYRPDSYPCFFTLSEPITVGVNECTPVVNGCVPSVSQARYQQLKFASPSNADCEAFSQIPTQEGAEFQVRVTLTGTATVDRLRLSANLNANLDLPGGDCAETFINDGSPITCCAVNDLNAYRIIPAPPS